MWIWIWWIYPYYILIWWMLIYVDIYIDDEYDLFHQCQDEPSRLPEFGRWLVLIFSAISKTWFALKTNWFDSYITAIAPLMLAMIFFINLLWITTVPTVSRGCVVSISVNDRDFYPYLPFLEIWMTLVSKDSNNH